MDMQTDMLTETPRRSGYSTAVRVIAFVLAVLMLLEVGLFNASTVRFLRESFAGTEYEDLADYLAEDNEYMSMSRLERMYAILGNLMKPETYEDYSTAASICIANEDYDRAAEYLAGCIDIFEGEEKELAELHVKLGCVHGLRDHWTMAETEFKRATETDAENANAWLLLSESQLRLGNYETALESVMAYSELAELNAAQLLAVAGMQLQTNAPQDAYDTCTAALELDDCDRAEAYYTRAQACYMLDDVDGAVADSEASYKEGNRDTELMRMLAMCYDVQGRFEESSALYAELIEAGAADLELYSQAVQTAYLQDDYETVVTLAEQALKMPGTAEEKLEIYKWLGAAYTEQQNYPAAEEALSTYLDNAQGGGELYYLRGLSRLAQEKYAEAEADFTVTLETEESLTDESLYNRGLCRLWLQDAEGAAADFQAVLDRDANPEIVAMVNELLELA